MCPGSNFESHTGSVRSSTNFHCKLGFQIRGVGYDREWAVRRFPLEWRRGDAKQK